MRRAIVLVMLLMVLTACQCETVPESALLGAPGTPTPRTMGVHPGGIVTAALIAKAQTALMMGTEPWVSGWNYWLARCISGLSEVPSAVVIFHDPGYYNDPVAHEAAKANLRDDVNAAFACALAAKIGYGLSAGTKDTYRAKARDLINNWASVNTGTSATPDQPDNGKLVMSYVGTAFVATAELLYDDPLWTTGEKTQFSTWADNVLFHDGEWIADDNSNNWASWGSLAALASAYWRNDTTDFNARVVRLKALIDSQIATDGSLPAELARTGDGAGAMWYTYFSLAPMTHSAWIVYNATGEDLFKWTPPTGGTIAQATEFFYQLALNPGAYPGDDPPIPDSWGGDFLFVMGAFYANNTWRNWADHEIGASDAAWKGNDLLYGLHSILQCAP